MTLSYIVPAHNSSDVIEATLAEIAERLKGTSAEIVVVENGSSDNTPQVLRQLADKWSVDGVDLRVLTSEKGLGNALRFGIAASKGTAVVLGADDLPFGFDDIDRAEKLDLHTHRVVVGSKAHPQSEVGRGALRAVLTWGFLTGRLIVLGMRTRDPQGTFVLDGEWVRSVVPQLRETGYLVTTELVYLAERAGIKPVEVPVRLRESHAEHSSRIKLKDVWLMGLGLFTIRRRHRKATRTAPAGSAARV